jgi:hypothetical protein
MAKYQATKSVKSSKKEPKLELSSFIFKAILMHEARQVKDAIPVLLLCLLKVIQIF